MKLNKIMMASVLVFGASTMAHAGNQGQGVVNFKGAIIDAPCSISPETVDQTVDLGQISKVVLKDGGKSVKKEFQVLLENCELEKDKSTVSLTFTGVENSDGRLEINGTAKGASIALVDTEGKPIKLGTATAAHKLTEGKNILRFGAYLQGDGASAAVVPGDFTSVADFTMSYQ
ncbi:type 1 fimbrial protein [Serratia sp. JUb9]|uniref:fimbrial protein n=1 Tax=unclassified Serratia (in: enterobacteria) TaxID=2647522 RepID=UPI000CF63BCA|nr:MULTISPECIES: fimbrial protein [unclassified Serratia (in: enterobacteria)]MCA4823892.1 type 1 fimbrial protein [Serratia rubidaea]AVJ18393.1 fimbria A protein [Serratia sp. MYb239]QNK34108.1 type 1 fimbrial protein [Serratia sp. JUb9]QPT11986.1 type 1 fimbrial protein [Serratia rubidaea]CAE1147684.1 Fimbria A protein [Serratia sp. Tan611]